MSRPAPGCLILVPIRAVIGDQVTGRRCCTESRRKLKADSGPPVKTPPEREIAGDVTAAERPPAGPRRCGGTAT